jgi:cytochrome c oxidase subunit 4
MSNELIMSDPHASHSESTEALEHTAHRLAHPVPLWLLLSIYGMLMLLTGLTVAATWIDVGMWNIWLALLIAVIKGGLVAMYFMHLRWDSPFNGIILITSLFFVALFVGSVVLDSREYKVNYNPPVRSGTLQP